MPDMVFIILCFLLVACTASPQQAVTYTRTPDPLQPYVDANSSQGTAVAAIATADYFSNQLTATVEARNHAAAQQAIWTQRAMDITATADIASVQAFATQQYSKARTEELSLKRKELMNNVAAIVPWAMLVITFISLAIFFKRWTRVRVIQRDPRGDAPLLLDVVDSVAYDADRNPTSTAGLQREDLKQLPQFSASDHTQTTARDQMVDIATRGLPGTNQRKGISNQLREEKLLGDGAMPKIEAIDSISARPLFKDVLPYIVQDSIDAEIISEEEGS